VRFNTAVKDLAAKADARLAGQRLLGEQISEAGEDAVASEGLAVEGGLGPVAG
jgi:hypothetical protein